ncbi:MAG TPA: pyridoxamine 5'-phosphate oxidase [Cyclobacteriaceae bacterium]|nr:pyridoxamine 5'-phosphate oxidase [Cyclobacteriaceae bacterium]
MKVISEIRTDYSKATLDINSVDKNPIIQFQKWFEQAIASQALEPNAMNLATLSEKGRPTSRIVLLKGIENEQFIFYTNYQSQKGRELELNPACALNFFWPELERQVRIEGVVSRVSADASDSYFQSRPRSSQVGAWASPQSTLIKERSILEERVVQIEKKYKDLKVLPRPKQWGGYGVTPFEIEFWQGRPNRLHDRIVYTLVDGKWKINRLAP